MYRHTTTWQRTPPGERSASAPSESDARRMSPPCSAANMKPMSYHYHNGRSYHEAVTACGSCATLKVSLDSLSWKSPRKLTQTSRPRDIATMEDDRDELQARLQYVQPHVRPRALSRTRSHVPGRVSQSVLSHVIGHTIAVSYITIHCAYITQHTCLHHTSHITQCHPVQLIEFILRSSFTLCIRTKHCHVCLHNRCRH